MNDFNPNTRLEQNADKFEIPVSKLSGLFRSLSKILFTDEKIRGLDLSHWNADEKIDFPVLKANGIDFVILKVTEGISFVDNTFQSKYIAALDAGLIVLPYHFFRGNYGGADQAKHCIDTLRTLGFLDTIDYVPVIWADVESNDGVSISTRRNRLLAFLQTIESNGFQAGVYSSPSYWNDLIGTVTWIANYWQWTAHWTWAAIPTLPINWTFAKALWWQNGIYPAHWWVDEVIGVEGNVDHNYFFGTLEDLKKLLKFPEVPPPGDCNCEEEIARLELEINSNKLEIYKLQQKDAEHTASTEDLYSIVYTLDTRMGEVEISIESLQEMDKALETDIIDLTDWTNEMVVMLRSEMEDLGNTVIEQNNSIDFLESTVSNQNSRIIALETLVSQLQAIFC